MNQEPTIKIEKRHRTHRRSKAIAWRDETISRLFSEIKRSRALEPLEKELFDRALAGLGPKRDVWRWSEKEDRRLTLVIRQWPRLKQQKPYERNDLIRLLAVELGRTEWAIYRRIERLRKRMKCSDAAAKANR